MALTPFQTAVSNLARSMGLRGEGERGVYSTPEYQQLYKQFFPDPVDLSKSSLRPEEQNLTDVLLNTLRTQFGPESGLNQINRRLMEPPQLAQLSPEDLANFAAIKAANDAQIADQQETLQGKLIASLYGRGVNQSSIANDAAADFAKVMGLLLTQSNADDAARRLDASKFVTQTGQGNLALAGQNELGALNAAIQQLAQLLNVDLGRGQTEATVGENRRQFGLELGEKQRQFDVQQANRPGLLSKLIPAIASLALAPVTGGASLAGLTSIFSNRGPGSGTPGAAGRMPSDLGYG